MGKENKNKEPEKPKGPPPPDSELAAEIKRDIGKK